MYQHAKFLVFASYTEGFGLPIIESIQRGTPVLAADVAVYREIAGEYCILFEQDNVQELCRRVEEYDREPERYALLKEKMKEFWTWDMAAAEMEEVLATVEKDK